MTLWFAIKDQWLGSLIWSGITRMSFARYIKFTSQLDAVEELPREMRRVLSERGIEVGSHTILEDEGWGFTFRYAGGSYQFCSRFDPTSEPLACMGWIERETGFLAGMFGPRETYNYPEIEPLVQSALASLPTVRDASWCSGDETDDSTNAA